MSSLPTADLVWALGSICALRQQSFSAELLEREFAPPHSFNTLISAGRALGLRIKQTKLKPSNLHKTVFSLPVALKPTEDVTSPSLGIVTAATDGKVILFRAGSSQPETLSDDTVFSLCSGEAWMTASRAEAMVASSSLSRNC